MGVGCSSSSLSLNHCGINLAIKNILNDGRCKKCRFLIHQTNLISEPLQLQRPLSSKTCP
uniref:Uncharacterized protein n=1 Tax=Arundo donax TaxID=35708 RepID=A0A0A9DWX7_ARUDO